MCGMPVAIAKGMNRILLLALGLGVMTTQVGCTPRMAGAAIAGAIVGGVVVAVGAALFLAIGTDVSEGIQGLLNSTSQIPAP